MTRIRASCPRCGEVDLVPAELHVQLVEEPGGSVGQGSSYRFTCPDCELAVTKPADARIVSLLQGGGVEVRRVAPPELEVELGVAGPTAHPEDPPDGPALTVDDLIALHALLDRDDWFERLLAQG